MKIGIVTDEISPKFEEAFHYCKEWGIDLVELRCLESGRVPNVDEEEIKRLIKLKDELGIKVTAVSPGMLKSPFSEQEKIKNEIADVLPASFKLAERLKTNMIIVFGFQRLESDKPEYLDGVVNTFGEVAEKAAKNGFKISVENEPGFWCDTGKNTAKIIEMVNMSNFGVNWDPGNATGTDEVPYPDGYNFLKKYVSNVHVKDTKVNSLIECFVVGEGIIDWEGQMEALLRDKPVEHVTIETHRKPLIENSKKNVDIIRSMIQKYQS
jgi:sugar phosphate isomerase/epimerase